MDKKSPIKRAVLRNPGQSLEERIDYLINEKAMTYFMMVLLMFVLTGYEWWRFIFDSPPQPWILTALLFIVIIYVIPKTLKIIKEVRNLRQGLAGERAVGQFLDDLRERGWKVIHDLVFEGYNLDHVLISRHGVFVVETKTMSKPAKGKPEIYYDGQQIIIDGYRPEKNPVTQVLAGAGSLQELILELTGKKYYVRPVVSYPGWYVNASAEAQKEVWVLSTRALPGFIGRQGEVLSNEDVASLTKHLRDYVRNQKNKDLDA